MRIRCRGHIQRRRRVLRAQVDVGGGLAGGRGQVKPADLVRRVRAQQQLARCHLAVPADLVTDTPVIGRGEGNRADGPLGHDEPCAARRLHVGRNKHLAADVAVPDLDRLTHRHGPPRCPPGCRPDASRAGAAGTEPAPCSDGQADVSLNLIGNLGADSAHGSQRLRDQGESGRMPPAGKAACRHLHRAAEFSLGQQPQVSFRTLAVHVPSVARVPQPGGSAPRNASGALAMPQLLWHRTCPICQVVCVFVS